MLPHLYSGLVGASTLIRASAATALGEISYRGHTNIPPLVYEAFSVLLHDQYVIVHQAAVRALRRFNLPEAFRLRAAAALLNIFLYYSDKHNDERFLVECINLLASWIDEFGNNSNAIRQLIIKIALKIDPKYLHNELRFLSHWFNNCDDLADLVIHVLPHIVDRQYNDDGKSWHLLQQLSDTSVADRQERFVETGIPMLNNAPWATYEIVERLSSAGAEEGAQKLANACVIQVPNTELKQVLRSAGRSIEIAVEFEAAVKSDNENRIVDLSKQWSQNFAVRERQRAESNERYSRTNLPTSH